MKVRIVKVFEHNANQEAYVVEQNYGVRGWIEHSFHYEIEYAQNYVNNLIAKAKLNSFDNFEEQIMWEWDSETNVSMNSIGTVDPVFSK